MNTINIPFDCTPFRLSGTVYGTLFNSRQALLELGGASNAPPYKAPPKAPVLYVKPRNTLERSGERIQLPASTGELQIGASLGLVFGRTACRVAPAKALEYLAGYTVVADFSVPHESFYRPSVRFKALDGSCVVGPKVVAREAIRNPDALEVRVWVEGRLVHTTSTHGMFRDAAKLISDVTDFMTLAPGDILMLGVAAGAPTARAGQKVAVDIAGIGSLENELAGEAL